MRSEGALCWNNWRWTTDQTHGRDWAPAHDPPSSSGVQEQREAVFRKWVGSENEVSWEKKEKQTKEERKTQDAAIWNDRARETSKGRSGTKSSERIKKHQAERETQIRSAAAAGLCCFGCSVLRAGFRKFVLRNRGGFQPAGRALSWLEREVKDHGICVGGQ